MALSMLAWVLLFITMGILAAKALTMPFAMVPVPITQIFMI
jgi:membrane protein DedA with SNARE-associated domain